MKKESILASLAYLNMWKDKLWYTVPTVVAVVVSQYGCAPTSTTSSENLPPPTKTTDEKDTIATETFESFTKSHPEYKGRQKDAIVINFKINGVGAYTIAINSTAADRAEINGFEYKIEGKVVTPYDGAVVWTEKRNPDGSMEWVRLAGVQFKSDEETIFTSWYYSPDAFNKDSGKEAEFVKVFAFNSKDDQYVFYPLIDPSTDILWNDDLAVVDASKYEPWDGIQPFTLPTGSIPEGPGKSGLMSIVAVEAVSEEFNSVQEEIAKSDIYTLTPDGIEVKTEEGTIIKIESIKPNLSDGTFIITIEGEEITTILETVSEQSLTFVDINGKVFTLTGDRLTSESPEPALPAEAVKSAQEYFGENFEITRDGKVIDKILGKEIQGFTIVPFNKQTMIPPYKKEVTWGWQRKYEFEGNPDFTVVGTEADVTVAEDGSLDMYAWGYKDGEFKRQKIEFAAANGGTVEIEGFSPQEVQQMIINDSSDDPKYKAYDNETLRQMSINHIPKDIVNKKGFTTFRGMWEPLDNYWYPYGSNFIPTQDPNGEWQAIETTTFMVYPEFEDRSKALVVWMGADNKPIVVAIETKYAEMPQYFNPYWKKHDIKEPFNP